MHFRPVQVSVLSNNVRDVPGHYLDYSGLILCHVTRLRGTRTTIEMKDGKLGWNCHA